MSDPLAIPSELGVYLGTTIDNTDERAILVLQLAHDKCEGVVSPVPALAKGVELSIAGRAYTNVTSAHQMSLGSGAVSFGAQNSTTGIGGLYLSRSEKAELRRLAGRSGAFSINLLIGESPRTVPVVSSAFPAGGVEGARVVFTGYAFTGTTAVTVGGVDSLFEVMDDGTLAVTVPAGTAGTVDVVVTNATGASQPFSYERG